MLVPHLLWCSALTWCGARASLGVVLGSHGAARRHLAVWGRQHRMLDQLRASFDRHLGAGPREGSSGFRLELGLGLGLGLGSGPT